MAGKRRQIEREHSACPVFTRSADDTAVQFENAPRMHTRRIMPMIRELLRQSALKPADLDALAFGRGPGSFTGLRIAAGIVQGLAFGLGKPVLPVSSLAATALVAREQNSGPVAVAFDARMAEVYWGTFRVEAGRVHPLEEERVCAPGRLSLPAISGEERWLGAGAGWLLCDEMPKSVSDIVTERLPDTIPTAGAREPRRDPIGSPPATQSMATYAIAGAFPNA